MASNSIIQYASSSSSSREIIKTYDVFVSFRGDTRNNFTDHLFGALHSKAIHFFRDDTKLKKGKHILPELLQAIDGSQILVVVFSKKYASSKWCLRELEKIAPCINVREKHVLPIFYDVTPSEVRNQSGNYKQAFDEYQKRFKEDKEKMEEVLRWRQALSQVANLSGWDIGNKPQHGEILKIVQNIQKILQQNIVCCSNDDLVGIKSPIEELENLLLLDSDDVILTLGICGMAGMGKTTLVTALCERIHSYFDFHYLVEDVNNSFQNSNIYGLRNQLLCQAPEEKNSLEICNVFPRINLVSHGRRLIVLDNVGHIEQLEKLNLNHKCLSPGSRIIIISKDRRILEDYGVNPIYHVRPLNDDNADQLFCKYAFKGNCVMSEYEELKYDVLSYLQGHPLLVKVMGRHLADQDVSQWTKALVKLRENPKKDILDKLRISFDELEQNEKEIFLDIACFYHWYSGKNVMEVLQFRGFEPESGLKILLKKSLITNYSKTWVEMPSLLIDLGKYIVKEKSPKEPREWSRLWDWQDIVKVLSDKKASKNLEAIIVTGFYPAYFAKTMKANTLSKMSQLKLLELHGLKFSGSLNDLSNKLGYLRWTEYPFKCLPPNFEPNNLGSLSMIRSNIKRLWKGRKVLPNLKYLDLLHCKKLVKMPDLGEAPNLKWLQLRGCIQLRKIHSSISTLRKLTFLDLTDCKSLVKMPDFGEALNLEKLSFQGCLELKEIHQSIGSLKKLRTLNLQDCRNLVSLPTSLLGLSSLENLNLSGCSNLYKTRLLEEPWLAKHFQKPCIGEAPIHSQPTSSFEEKSFMPSDNCLLLSSPSFPCMRYLNLSFCNLHQIPDAIGNLFCLERLNLSGNKFEKMPSLKKLSKLLYINLQHCKQLKYLFELPSQTEFTSEMNRGGLYMFNCRELVGSEEWIIPWMIQYVKADHHPCIESPSRVTLPNINIIYRLYSNIGSVIPGNEIPRWFNIQHVGMSNPISVDGSPLGQDDNDWIGVAFCVVFCVSHHGKKSHPKQERDCTYSHHGKQSLPKQERDCTFFIEVLLCVDLVVDLVTDNSDHIYVFYFTRSNWGTFISDDLQVYFGTLVPDWHVEVKKYGYRWVYESDLQLSNIPSNHCKTQSNRKRKFFQIKQNQ